MTLASDQIDNKNGGIGDGENYIDNQIPEPFFLEIQPCDGTNDDDCCRKKQIQCFTHRFDASATEADLCFYLRRQKEYSDNIEDYVASGQRCKRDRGW